MFQNNQISTFSSKAFNIWFQAVLLVSDFEQRMNVGWAVPQQVHGCALVGFQGVKPLVNIFASRGRINS